METNQRLSIPLPNLLSCIEFYNLLQEPGISKGVFDVRSMIENEEGFIRNTHHLSLKKEKEPEVPEDLLNLSCNKYYWDSGVCSKKISNDWKTRKIFACVVIYDAEGKPDGAFTFTNYILTTNPRNRSENYEDYI